MRKLSQNGNTVVKLYYRDLIAMINNPDIKIIGITKRKLNEVYLVLQNPEPRTEYKVCGLTNERFDELERLIRKR